MVSFGRGLSRVLGWAASVSILALWTLAMVANQDVVVKPSVGGRI